MQLAEELSLLAEDCKDHLIPSYLAEELASALVYYKTKQAEAKRVSDRKKESRTCTKPGMLKNYGQAFQGRTSCSSNLFNV